MEELEKRKEQRERAIEYARYVAKCVGGGIRVKKAGTNSQTIRFIKSDGLMTDVWLPVEGRVNDIDLQDMTIVTREFYARPDVENIRGHHVCCICGGSTKSVLDGEAWCCHCERYQ